MREAAKARGITLTMDIQPEKDTILDKRPRPQPNPPYAAVEELDPPFELPIRKMARAVLFNSPHRAGLSSRFSTSSRLDLATLRRRRILRRRS